MERSIRDLQLAREEDRNKFVTAMAAMKEGMERLHRSAVARDEFFDKALDGHRDRLQRHRSDLNTIRRAQIPSREVIDAMLQRHEEGIEAIDDRLKVAEGRLCRCGERMVPVLSGSGTSSDPHSIEGSELSYLTPPTTNAPAPSSSSHASVPSENVDPIPVLLRLIEEPVIESIADEGRYPAQECRVCCLQRASKRLPFKRNPHTMVPGQGRGGEKDSGWHRNDGYYLPNRQHVRRLVRSGSRGVELGGYASDSEPGTSGLSDVGESHLLPTAGGSKFPGSLVSFGGGALGDGR